jgi:hypothetical protein
MPNTQAGNNIANQFGMPLFGIAGVLPFLGNYFWVDPTNGSDGNTGGPQDPLKSLTAALTLCTAGNNDVVILTGTYNPTAALAWSKNNTHLIGLAGSGLSGGATISVASAAATTGAFSPLVNVTASGCIFKSLTAISGIAQAAAQVCWAEAGGKNTYIDCSFNQVANATAAAHAGNRALTIASVGNSFINCVIGGDQIVRATGTNSTIEFLVTGGDTKFDNCVLAMWTSVAANTHVSAATTTMSGFNVFNNCTLVNNLQGAGGTALTAAFSIHASAGGVILLSSNTTSIGATKISAAGPVYVGGAVPTAATSNLAVAAT